MDKIIILGSGPSLNQYKYKDRDIVYALGTAYPTFKDRVSVYFCIHGDERDNFKAISESGKKYITADDSGDGYYTSSIAYMLSYAIESGAAEISLYGIDCDPQTEWYYERPCIMYWIGKAEGMGISVFMVNDWRKSIFQYGRDEKYYLPLVKRMETREREILDKLKRETSVERAECYKAALNEVIKMRRGLLA